MTEYLLSVWMDADFDPAAVSEEDTQRMYAQVDVFNTKLQTEGKWVFAGGLTQASSATVVSPTGDLTDGPFSEAKEQLGGFWVIKAADLDEALALAKEGAKACEGTVEVRAFQSE